VGRIKDDPRIIKASFRGVEFYMKREPRGAPLLASVIGDLQALREYESAWDRSRFLNGVFTQIYMRRRFTEMVETLYGTG
jgi:hypothetical protein